MTWHQGKCHGGPCDGKRVAHWGNFYQIVEWGLMPQIYPLTGVSVSADNMTSHTYMWDSWTNAAGESIEGWVYLDGGSHGKET